MMVNIKSALLITIVLLSACDSGPKVISASEEDANSEKSSGIFSDNPAIIPDASGMQPYCRGLDCVLPWPRLCTAVA